MRHLSRVGLAVIVGVALFAPRLAGADAIPDLCNTGQPAGCSGVLADSALDPNYELIAAPGGVTLGDAKVVIADGFPIPPWVANDADSKWVGPPAADTNSNGPAGSYTYRTTFDLTGLDPTTAEITGLWATDDPGTDILINGTSTGQTSPSLSSFTAFIVTSGFVGGVNTLDFVLTNGGGPTGLRVDNIVGTADPSLTQVPWPGSLLLLSLASIAGAGRAYRRRVRATR